MLHQLLSVGPHDAPRLGKYESYAALKTELDKFAGNSLFNTKLLAEVPSEPYSWMCHLHTTSAVLHWMKQNGQLKAEPPLVRKRNKKTAEEIKDSEVKERAAIPSMRALAKKEVGSAVGEIGSGDELCTVVNSIKKHDPQQKYTAKSFRAASKEDYINTITSAIDGNSPPIVAFDYIQRTPIEERKGEREHASYVLGYIQTKGESPQTLFVIPGLPGYWIVSADQLYASAHQLESKYPKEKMNFELENKGRTISEADREAHERYLKLYSDCDAVKVKMKEGSSWLPVSRLWFFTKVFEIENMGEVKEGLSQKDRRKIKDRAENGWRDTVVVIQPDEPTGPKLGGA